ncbi:MAG: sigma-70 family RNA polymerase sigma factor [Pseudomonadota bacterium]
MASKDIKTANSLVGSAEGADFAYIDCIDSELVIFLQQGDMRALDVLMRRHRGLVWRITKQHLGSLNDAEDIFQDVSLHLIQNPQSYQVGHAKFSSWLFRVVTNRCLDILRSKSCSIKQGELNDAIPNGLPTAEENISRHELSQHLVSLMEALPTQQKLALSLYYYEEMDLLQISNRLCVTEGAARALIKRGRDNLRGMDSSSYLI